jgi:hypothetical protein
MYFNGTINQTGGANGTTGAISINPTLTAVGGTYYAIEISADNANAKGIYQTGTATTNNIVGATAFGTVATVQDFSAQGSLGAALNAAAAANAVVRGLSIFMFGGNTYAYIENTAAGATFDATNDFLLQLDGVMFTTSTALTNTGFTVG